MADLVMVAVLIAATLLLAAYVAVCDRVVASGDEAAPAAPAAEPERRAA